MMSTVDSSGRRVRGSRDSKVRWRPNTTSDRLRNEYRVRLTFRRELIETAALWLTVLAGLGLSNSSLFELRAGVVLSALVASTGPILAERLTADRPRAVRILVALSLSGTILAVSGVVAGGPDGQSVFLTVVLLSVAVGKTGCILSRRFRQSGVSE